MDAMNSGMNTAFIGMGSNLGDGKATLLGAWKALAEVPGITTVKLSSPYLTEPVGMTSQHWFTNSVAEIQSDLPPLSLLAALMRIESEFGRVRDKNVFGLQDRSLDLDLLYVGDQVVDVPELILPHPRVAARLFVLAPLSEIAPDFVDCIQNKTMQELHDELIMQIASGLVKKQEIIRSKWES